MEKLNKKTSIIYNQMWINKVIEEGHMDLLPSHMISNLTIGEYIEAAYLGRYDEKVVERIKITKSDSILFEQEYKELFKEKRISLPTIPANTKYSLVELMEQKYNELEEIEKRKMLKIEKCIQLDN